MKDDIMNDNQDFKKLIKSFSVVNFGIYEDPSKQSPGCIEVLQKFKMNFIKCGYLNIKNLLLNYFLKIGRRKQPDACSSDYSIIPFHIDIEIDEDQESN